jgi:hypothetical protein
VSRQLGTRDLIGYARVSTDEQNLDLQIVLNRPGFDGGSGVLISARTVWSWRAA